MSTNHPDLGVGLHYLRPAVPLVLRLPSHLRPGRQISIFGEVPDGANKFVFNLQKGAEQDASDVVFHVSPRFNPPMVARNNCVRGTWGMEEFNIPGKFPFSYKTSFRVDIKVTEQYYKVVINNEPLGLCEFKHRESIDSPTHLCIKGDVEISRVTFSESLFPTLLATLPSSLKVGDICIVQGHPIGDTANFAVAVHSDEKNEDSDVLLAVNPRLRSDQVVRSSFLRTDENWGKEETQGGNPFSDGRKFVLALEVFKDLFDIAINGIKFAEYKHRMNIDSAKILLIRGDVSINNVIIEAPSIKPVTLEGISIGLIPAFYPIPGLLSKGKTMRITGTPARDCVDFIIQLSVDEDLLQRFLLSLKFRFDIEPKEMSVTSIQNNHTEPEIYRPVPFPVKLGEEFELTVLNDGARFVARINGKEVFTSPSGGHKLADYLVIQAATLLYIKSIRYT